MNKRLMHFVWALLLIIGAQTFAAAPLLFDRREYAARRGRLMDKIPGGIAVLFGASTPASDREIIRYGGYNHMIGLATHDVTGTSAGPNEVLQPGFVFACDIQLFRLEEEIGIRIEDTIAITESGYENLSLGVPLTVAEIEALKKDDGIIQIAGKIRSKREKR